MENTQKDEIEIDLREIFGVLRARFVSILASGVILAALFGLGTSFLIEPDYISSSKLYIVNQTSSITSLADLQTGTQLTQDYMVLVKSRPVLEKVISNLGLDISYEDLVSMVSLANETDTRILTITVTTNDPYMAKEIVDEITSVSISRIATIMNVTEPTIVEYGHLESSPSSPNLKKNVLIGGLIGLVVSAGFAVVMFLLNDTIRTEEDVTKYLGLNTLGNIPIEEGTMEQMLKDKRKRRGERTLASRLKRFGKGRGKKDSKD